MFLLLPVETNRLLQVKTNRLLIESFTIIWTAFENNVFLSKDYEALVG